MKGDRVFQFSTSSICFGDFVWEHIDFEINMFLPLLSNEWSLNSRSWCHNDYLRAVSLSSKWILFGTCNMCFADVIHHNSTDGAIMVYWVNRSSP